MHANVYISSNLGYCFQNINQYLFIYLFDSIEIRALHLRSKDNSQRFSSEQNHESLISDSLLLNKLKIDQVSSIFYPEQICENKLKRLKLQGLLKLKRLKLQGLLSFNQFYHLS